MTKKLTMAALLVAIDIIATRFMFVYSPGYLVRISPQFLAHGLAGWLLGPYWAVLTAVAGDVMGMLTNPAGLQFFPGFTLSAALNGLIYGLLLYKRPVRLWRCAAAVSVQVLTVSLLLGAVWNSVLYQKGWLAVILASLPWRLLTLPLYTAGLFAVQKALVRTKLSQ